jgi:hypothetical protein
MELQDNETTLGDHPPDARTPDNGRLHEYHLGEAPTLDKLKEYNSKFKIKVPGFIFCVTEKGRRGCVRVETLKCRSIIGQARLYGMKWSLHKEVSYDIAAGTLKITKKIGVDGSKGKWIGSLTGGGKGTGFRSSREVIKEINLNTGTGTIQTTQETTVANGQPKKKVERVTKEPDIEGQQQPSDRNSRLWNEMGRKFETQYVVTGLFSRIDGMPREHMIKVEKPAYLFWYMSWDIIRLRGISAFFSLKGVKGFALYKVSFY